MRVAQARIGNEHTLFSAHPAGQPFGAFAFEDLAGARRLLIRGRGEGRR